MKIDLDRFVPKLQRDEPQSFKSNKTVEDAIEEYRHMLTLVQKYPENPVVPSKLVDLVWHSHILDTEKYKRDSLRMFGRYLHHAPSFGGEEEKQELVTMQKAMFKDYEKEFGRPAPKDMWDPSNGVGEFSGEKSPDCCAASCVKPSCQGCVGCNSQDCGYMGAPPTAEEGSDAPALRERIFPEQFAGYIPTELPLKITAPDVAYKCSISPFPERKRNSHTPLPPKMKLSWSVSNGYAYFEQAFLGEAWAGFGLNNKTDMGKADYMITMNNNYTGVKDMYKWDEGNGWPCWDVEYECSTGNKTKGTKDVEDDSVQRADGNMLSTWNRKLITGDTKDYAIKDEDVHVLFAYGVDDYFTFHGDNAITCLVNFYSGAYTCPAPSEGRRRRR
jgi:hypothetical protein